MSAEGCQNQVSVGEIAISTEPCARCVLLKAAEDQAKAKAKARGGEGGCSALLKAAKIKQRCGGSLQSARSQAQEKAQCKMCEVAPDQSKDGMDPVFMSY